MKITAKAAYIVRRKDINRFERVGQLSEQARVSIS